MGVDLSGLFKPEYVDDDGELTALENADIPRVDLVEMGANGVPRFLIAKHADGPAGLMSADYVRSLIGKPEPVVKQDGEMVTMSGSPAAVARFIHQAAQRREHDTGPAGSVAKETSMPDDLDASVVLAEPDTDAPGLDTQPSSPAWEAVDAATARKWTSILARARGAVSLLADREMLEAAAGDEGDGVQSVDLEDAACAIDYAISVLAPFAVSEQAEAETGDMAAVGKALAGFDPAVLDTVESLGVVRKAGRVLSSSNEAAIRDAVDKLQKVLASLPQAPAVETVEKSGPPVADPKESVMSQPTGIAEAVVKDTEPAQPATVAETETAPQDVAKADGEGKAAMRAVYDAKGHLVGIVDPADITPIEDAAPGPDDKPDAPAEADAAPAADMAPAPAAEVGTPADATDDDLTKTTEPTDDAPTTDMLKSIADVIREQLAAHSATQQQVVAKQAADLTGMAETVETLKGQVKALEEQPAEPKVFTNGAVPPPHLLRGQDRGSTPVDVAKAQELKKTLYQGTAQEQNRAFNDMQELAVAKLRELHQRPGA